MLTIDLHHPATRHKGSDSSQTSQREASLRVLDADSPAGLDVPHTHMDRPTDATLFSFPALLMRGMRVATAIGGWVPVGECLRASLCCCGRHEPCRVSSEPSTQ
jgi:hypothetical protein